MEPWSGVRDATIPGPPCAQNPWFIRDAKQTSREDCLYLNVWTPVTPGTAAHLPVMVWIPGGGNFAGDASGEAYGDELVRHGVVVVTLNYRLGLFGFLSLPQLTAESPHHASGNQGILDQIAALHWVHDNIAQFGGDPGNVTIFGESAGSLDVSVLMTTPLARGLFRHVIAESGPVVLVGTPLTLGAAEKLGLSYAAAWTGDAHASMATLRALPASAILAREPNFLLHPPINLGITVDGYVFPRRPAEVFASGRELHADLLQGNLAHEWIPGVNPPADLRQAIDATYPAFADRALQLYTSSGTDSLYGTPAEAWVEDIGFRCATVEQVTWHATAGNRTWEFQFDHLPPGFPPDRNAHHQEVQYVFGLRGANFQPVDSALSDAMQQYWTNFAKTGDPNGTGPLPKWPRFTPGSGSYMAFTDTGLDVRHNLRSPFCKLWNDSTLSHP